MGQRGRPPHPDILTPRQWEVLSLIRDGRTDQQIADRLGISLDGAKYHVSEILSRLGVETREEAAGWPGSRRRTWGHGAWALAWKAAAASLVGAAAIGIGVLAWGVAESGRGTSEPEATPDLRFEQLDLPPPVNPPTQSRGQALLQATGGFKPAAVDVQVTTVGAIIRSTESGLVAGMDSTATGWIVRFLGITDEFGGQPHSWPMPISVEPEPTPQMACRETTSWFLDNENEAPSPIVRGSFSVDAALPGEMCLPEIPISQDLAVVFASRVLPPREIGAALGEVTASGTTFEAAYEALVSRFGPMKIVLDVPGHTNVWYVTMTGEFLFDEDADGVYPEPLPYQCLEFGVIIDEETGREIVSNSGEASGC